VIWRFSDGTTVELGGNVEGATLLAQRVRHDIESGRVEVSIWPPPDDRVPLDVNDAAILNAYLSAVLDFWTRVRGLKLTLQRPGAIPALPPPPWAGTELVEGRIY
jgi:hypothetical protein